MRFIFLFYLLFASLFVKAGDSSKLFGTVGGLIINIHTFGFN